MSKTASKTAPSHPPYLDMIVDAIKALKDRTGSSRQAIEKYILANNKIESFSPSHLKAALKRGVVSGRLVQKKGKGASGSFKVGAEARKPKPTKPKPTKPKPTKPKTPKPKTPKPKTPKPKKAKSTTKKPKTKTTTKKSPKKTTTKKADAKKPQKTTKPKKSPGKKAGAKKPAAKKSTKAN